MRTASPSTTLAWVGASEPVAVVHVEGMRERAVALLDDAFGVGVVERGAARVCQRGQVEVHRPGGIVVIEPGQVHSAQAVACEAWELRMLHVPAATFRRLAGLPAAPSGTAPRFDASWYADAELASRVRAAHAVWARAGSATDASAVDAVLAELLQTLVGRHGAPAPSHAVAHAAVHAAVRRVVDVLHARIGEPVRLAELADVAGMGPFALIRLFGRVVGVPPYAYLELLRVERAKRMLRGGAAITEVAYATGFSDQSHLTRHFRRVVGVPPGQYARGHAACVASTAASAVRRVA